MSEPGVFQRVMSSGRLIPGVVVALALAGAGVSILTGRSARPSNARAEQGEQQKWWDLGYKSGATLGKLHGEKRSDAPTEAELVRSARQIRGTLGVTAAGQAEEFDRGFKYGFRDSYKATTKPAF